MKCISIWDKISGCLSAMAVCVERVMLGCSYFLCRRYKLLRNVFLRDLYRPFTVLNKCGNCLQKNKTKKCCRRNSVHAYKLGKNIIRIGNE